MKSVLILALLSFSIVLFGQRVNISLSPEHNEKLNKFNGSKRMLKYYKYYKADSTKSVKAHIKQDKKNWDSLRRVEILNARVTEHLDHIKNKEKYIDSIQQAYITNQAVLSNSDTTSQARRNAREQLNRISKNKVTMELAQRGGFYSEQFKSQDSVKNELKKWWAIMKDPDTPDSIKTAARENAKELVLAQANTNPQFKGILEDYKLNGQMPDWATLESRMPGLDTLSVVFDSSLETFITGAEALATKAASKTDALKGLSEMAGKVENLKDNLTNMGNSENIVQEGKEALKDKAIDHFENHADKLNGPQEKLTKLVSKYKSFTNSEDLSSAVKRTSLQGKTFWERLVVGGNFNVVSTKPFSIDLSPLIGYRFNTKLYAGIGMNYRYTFGDSIKYPVYISPHNSSVRIFGNYDLIKNFFSYAEFERSGLRKSGEKPTTTWSNTYFIGVGKKLLIHPKVFMVVTALYRINQETSHSYPGRFQMRVGFQSSDLAFRKKKVYYNR